ARPRGSFVSRVLFQLSCFRLAAALLLAPPLLAPAVAMTIQPVSGASEVEAWLVGDHTVPVVTIRFAFPGGAALDPAAKSGAAWGCSTRSGRTRMGAASRAPRPVSRRSPATISPPLPPSASTAAG